MVKRIREDHREFRDIVSGRLRENLKKFVTSGRILRHRANGKGQIAIPVPRIDKPYIVFGSPDDGVGRGPGKKGDVVGQDPEPGSKGNQAGQEAGEGMLIDVDMEEIFKLMEEELKLPHMLPKSTQTFEEILIRYNNISKVGSRSLLHKRRSIKECMKRQIASGTWGDKVLLPGFNTSLPLLQLSQPDFRFRQWDEIRKPSSNALIIFARDGSGSMDNYKCEIVSDMAWWLDLWIRRDYKKTERLYVWHDTEAREVSEEEFYKLRYGGGTICSSSLKLIQKIIKHRFPPEKWNIYIFYFGDGENWGSDNKVFVDTIKQGLNNTKVNMVGVTQVLAWNWGNSLKRYVDDKIGSGYLDNSFVRTTAIGGDQGEDSDEPGGSSLSSWYPGSERDAQTDEQVKKALVDLLGQKQVKQ